MGWGEVGGVSPEAAVRMLARLVVFEGLGGGEGVSASKMASLTNKFILANSRRPHFLPV